MLLSLGLPEPPEVVVPTFTRPTLLEPPVPAASSSMSTVSSSTRRAESNGGRPRSASSSSCNSSKKQQQQQCHHTAATKPVSERQLRLERMRLQREMLYNNAIECPICFLVGDSVMEEESRRITYNARKWVD